MVLSEIRNGKRITASVSGMEFEKEYDVIVCGLGTAGAVAALFSAEDGLSVLGVEQFTCTGGTHTAGGISHPYFGCPGGRYLAFDEKVDAFSEKYCATRAEAGKLVKEEC